MSICDLCEQDKDKAYSCLKRIEGQIPFGEETQLSLLPHNCPECHVGTGGFHHLGCGIEQCPQCYGQILFCLCEGGEAYRTLAVNVWWTRLRKALPESVVTGSAR